MCHAPLSRGVFGEYLCDVHIRHMYQRVISNYHVVISCGLLLLPKHYVNVNLVEIVHGPWVQVRQVAGTTTGGDNGNAMRGQLWYCTQV